MLSRRAGRALDVDLGILSDMWCGTGKPCGAGSSANFQFWAFHSILSALERLPRPELSGRTLA